jgi:hypothetical protein
VQAIPVRAFRLEPGSDKGVFSIDGEALAPQPIQAEVFPGALRIYGCVRVAGGVPARRLSLPAPHPPCTVPHAPCGLGHVLEHAARLVGSPLVAPPPPVFPAWFTCVAGWAGSKKRRCEVSQPAM